MIKYPRTPHFPWSEGITSDDKIISSLDAFVGARVIVTEKLDGENTTLYRDGIHARSLNGRHHESRDWVKGFHSSIEHLIPEGWRVCGENMYATHSIEYTNLSSYFYGFSIWNEQNVCLSWDETMYWFDRFDIMPVPLLFDGEFNQAFTQGVNGLGHSGVVGMWASPPHETEGYVTRVARAFAFEDFAFSVAKFVREGHVQTDEHWAKNWKPNKLKNLEVVENA